MQDSENFLFGQELSILKDQGCHQISRKLVADKILARLIGRNREQVIFYKDLGGTIRRLHQTIGNRKGHQLYFKNHKFSKILRNYFSQELENR